ncbi:MAG: hypothetical protein AAF358_20920 [Pseudomonadota bacterium]
MATALQWFLFGMFVWACCVLMSALESRVSANGEARRQRREVGKRPTWWRQLWDESLDDEETEEPTQRERAMAAEIVELKDRIATLEAIVTDRKFQWEDELRK